MNSANSNKTTEQIQDSLPEERQLNLIAESFKVLSDPARLKIVMALLVKELCVNDLAAIAELSQPSVSYHLKTLRQLNLVNHRKEGKQTYYSLADDHVSALLSIAEEHSTELI